MCFSAQASFVTGLGLLGLGTVTVKRSRTRGELLYASIPLLFGIQQLLEGILWLTFANDTPALSVWVTHLYLLLSNVVWPTYVPLAVLALETEKYRRLIITAIASIGAAVSLYLLAILILQPITSSVYGHHILYDFPNPYEQATIGLYVIATCISLLFSSHPRVVTFGFAVFISEVLTYKFYNDWYISVWCFFAALLSIIVLWQQFEGRHSKSPIS